MNVKIMSYNVLTGFHDGGTLNRKRLAAAKRTVKKENPDVLVICEAYYGGPNQKERAMNYKKVFGFKNEWYAPWYDQKGICLLSNFDIVHAQAMSDPSGMAFHSELFVKNKSLFLGAINPSPFMSDVKRVKFARPLLKLKRNPYVLIGDYNAISDEDKYNKKVEAKDMKDRLPESWKVLINGLFQKKLIPFIRKQGLRDAFPKKDRTYTIPTSFSDRFHKCDMRIDHCFVSKDVKVKRAKVVKNKDTEIASDHYPIVCTISI